MEGVDGQNRQAQQERERAGRWLMLATLAGVGGACVLAFAILAALGALRGSREQATAQPTATPTTIQPTATPTTIPALVISPVSGPYLGGPLSAFDSAYGSGGGSGDYTSALVNGYSVTIIVSVTHLGESEDGQPRAVIVDLIPNGGFWTPGEAAAIAQAFLPPDARHTRNVPSQFGLDHQYTSAQLAASLAPSAFLYPDADPAPVGWLDWSCHLTASGHVDTCEVAA